MAHQQSQSGSRVPNPIQIQKFLGGMEYPARKEDLIRRAEQEGADPTVLDALKRIPDEAYSSPTALSRALGQLG